MIGEPQEELPGDATHPRQVADRVRLHLAPQRLPADPDIFDPGADRAPVVGQYEFVEYPVLIDDGAQRIRRSRPGDELFHGGRGVQPLCDLTAGHDVEFVVGVAVPVDGVIDDGTVNAGQDKPPVRLLGEQKDIVCMKCLGVLGLRLDLVRDDVSDGRRKRAQQQGEIEVVDHDLAVPDAIGAAPLQKRSVGGNDKPAALDRDLQDAAEVCVELVRLRDVDVEQAEEQRVDGGGLCPPDRRRGERHKECRQDSGTPAG